MSISKEYYQEMEKFYKCLLGAAIFTIIILLVMIITGALMCSFEINNLNKKVFILQHSIVEHGCADFKTNNDGSIQLKWKNE